MVKVCGAACWSFFLGNFFVGKNETTWLKYAGQAVGLHKNGTGFKREATAFGRQVMYESPSCNLHLGLTSTMHLGHLHQVTNMSQKIEICRGDFADFLGNIYQFNESPGCNVHLC